MIEILAIVCSFAAVLLIVVGMRSNQVDPVEARLRSVQTGMRPRSAALAQPFILRAAAPMAGGFVKLIMRLLPTTWVTGTERKITQAGDFMPLSSFLLLWVICTATFGVVAFMLADALGFGTIMITIVIASGIALGALTPQLWLRSRVNERRYYVRKALPDALDLLTTSVEAGLSLDAALIRVAEFQRGPLQDELVVAMQDITLGKSRRDALDELSQRLEVPEVISLVQTINQAEVTGAPIGQVLRAQAHQVRVKRRQAAEAQAQRAPLLMIGPLVFLILPSMFVVLLAPAALTIIDLLTNSTVFNR